MAYVKGQPFKPQFTDPATNTLMSNGTVEFYLTGTSTPTPYYTDSSGTAGGTSLTLDSGGKPSTDIFFDTAITYKLVVKNAAGGVVETLDPFSVPDISLRSSLAATNGSELVTHTQSGNNYNLSTYLKNRYVIQPEDYGAVGDGSTDDTLAIKTAADAIQEAGGNAVLRFRRDATYLISYQGAAYSSVNGNVVCNFSDVPNVKLEGNGCTIKCVNHDIGANGGLLFAQFSGVSSPEVTGFKFDMSFTGANTSGSHYPFCGGIVFSDSSSGSKTQEELCSGISVHDLQFKLYHPQGSYQQSPSAYSGDPNNGFKIFSVFASGDYLATGYTNQNRGCTIEKIRYLEGHNAYGIWVWSYNDVKIRKITAESWVSKYSNAAGAVAGAGVPLIRYHQFHCSGLDIDGIYFRAKPCNERLTVGFEGDATLASINTNLTGNYSHGATTISNIIMILGHGDLANSLFDYGIHMFHYGVTNISNVACDATTETTNATGDYFIRAAPEVGGADGFALLNIDNVTFSKNCDYGSNIIIENGAPTAAQRRLKQVNISNITSYGQGGSVVQVGKTSTCFGVEALNLSNITCDGSDNSVWDSASTNSRALALNCSEADDTITIDTLNIRDTYYAVLSDQVNCTAGNFTIKDLKKKGVTSDYSLDIPVIDVVGTGDPEGAVTANIGSIFRRADGGATTSIYIKESGTGNTGWVAK